MAQVEVITGTSRRPYLYRGTEAGAVSHCFISWGVCVRDVIRRHDIRIPYSSGGGRLTKGGRM